jgi:hypothetical protein
MITGKIQGADKLIKQLKKLGPLAGKILRTELRQTANEIKSDTQGFIPLDTGKLRRSLSVRVIKKKKRYTVGFRIFCKEIKGRKYYAPMVNYGVHKRKMPKGKTRKHRRVDRTQPGNGQQHGHHFFEKGLLQAEAQVPATLQRLRKAIESQGGK